MYEGACPYVSALHCTVFIISNITSASHRPPLSRRPSSPLHLYINLHMHLCVHLCISLCIRAICAICGACMQRLVRAACNAALRMGQHPPPESAFPAQPTFSPCIAPPTRSHRMDWRNAALFAGCHCKVSPTRQRGLLRRCHSRADQSGAADSAHRVPRSGFRAPDSGFWVPGSGFQVPC